MCLKREADAANRDADVIAMLVVMSTRKDGTLPDALRES